MNRVSSFLTGLIVGAAGLYWAMTFHVVRAEDGVHVVPKVAAGIREAYVDVRQFGPEQWNEHRGLAAALVHADKEELITDSAMSNLRFTALEALESLGWKKK